MALQFFIKEENVSKNEGGGYIEENALFIQELAFTERLIPSPTDLIVEKMIKTELKKLSWYNYDITPKKLKLTNTGSTLIISGKWGADHPFICDGPLNGGYSFSQIHFHWGKTDDSGSENTIKGKRYPAEMHVVLFRSRYKTQDEARKKNDGIIIMVYFLIIQDNPNDNLDIIIRAIQYIKKAHASIQLYPVPLTALFHIFEEDYFLYWGSVLSEIEHNVQWFICRHPIGISKVQLQEFRTILNENHQPVVQNYREVVSQKRPVFHIRPVAADVPYLTPYEKVTKCPTSKAHQGQRNKYHDQK